MTFILRLCRDETGRLTGIVERVRTGEKERFHALETLAQIIGRMAANEANTNTMEEEERP